MALVSIPPSPHPLGTMSNRRVPLSNIANAANSPFRAVAAAASKRSRSQNTTQDDLAYNEPPPAKKQIIEVGESAIRTPPRRQIPQNAEGRVFNKRPANSQITAFEKKLLAAKDRKAQQKPGRQEKALSENLETIRQWQRHYRKVFPQFIFYFESVPDDVRLRCSKQVLALGAVSDLETVSRCRMFVRADQITLIAGV